MKKNTSPILRVAVLVGLGSVEAIRSSSAHAAAFHPRGPAGAIQSGRWETQRCASARGCLHAPVPRRRRSAFELQFPNSSASALHAKRARAAHNKKVAHDGSDDEGRVDLGSKETTTTTTTTTATATVAAPALVDSDADLLDVDQEPPPKKKRGRKAGTAKSKKNGSASKADSHDGQDQDAAEEELLHWTLESDRATIQYRPIEATIDGATTNAALVSLLARKGSSASRLVKANVSAVSAAGNATLPLSRPVSLVRFTVRGAPRPLVRHRVSTFRMYNPSAKAQKSFQHAVKALLSNAVVVRENPAACIDGDIVDTAPNQADTPAAIGAGGTVLFPTESLAVSIAFRMRRPLHHFRANRRGPAAGGLFQLKASAPPQTFVTRSDVDNLAKFVLDSFNGLLYDDDRQVCSLHATKILDNDGLCLGSTEVCVRVVGDDDLPQLLDKSFQLF
jgi:Endodeoxyribonuclease RusA